jgi:hypothetical protein
MKEYRVEWVKCPTAYNEQHVTFVEAMSPGDATELVRRYIERKLGSSSWLAFSEPEEVTPPPAGRVLEG